MNLEILLDDIRRGHVSTKDTIVNQHFRDDDFTPTTPYEAWQLMCQLPIRARAFFAATAAEITVEYYKSLVDSIEEDMIPINADELSDLNNGKTFDANLKELKNYLPQVDKQIQDMYDFATKNIPISNFIASADLTWTAVAVGDVMQAVRDDWINLTDLGDIMRYFEELYKNGSEYIYSDDRFPVTQVVAEGIAQSRSLVEDYKFTEHLGTTSPILLYCIRTVPQLGEASKEAVQDREPSVHTQAFANRYRTLFGICKTRLSYANIKEAELLAD